MSGGLIDAGEKAVVAAKEFWNLDIIDPSSKDHSEQAERSRMFIDSIIRTGAGLNWTWEHEYKGDGDFAWCGAFVAACWAKAGMKLNVREKHFASTYRLDRYAQETAVTPQAQVKIDELVSRGYCRCESLDAIKAFNPRPGDIGLVGEKGYGTHIVLIKGIIGNLEFIETIEGNGFGAGPDGKAREGVVNKKRFISNFRRILRPALTDLAV